MKKKELPQVTEKRIATNIKLFRQRAGITQVELSERSGVSQGHISGLESGNYKATVFTLGNIAFALDTTICELTEYQG